MSDSESTSVILNELVKMHLSLLKVLLSNYRLVVLMLVSVSFSPSMCPDDILKVTLRSVILNELVRMHLSLLE